MKPNRQNAWASDESQCASEAGSLDGAGERKRPHHRIDSLIRVGSSKVRPRQCHHMPSVRGADPEPPAPASAPGASASSDCCGSLSIEQRQAQLEAPAPAAARVPYALRGSSGCAGAGERRQIAALPRHFLERGQRLRTPIRRSPVCWARSSALLDRAESPLPAADSSSVPASSIRCVIAGRHRRSPGRRQCLPLQAGDGIGRSHRIEQLDLTRERFSQPGRIVDPFSRSLRPPVKDLGNERLAFPAENIAEKKAELTSSMPSLASSEISSCC